MAIIKCQECQKDISDKALICPHCGCPMEVSKVIIYGNTQFFLTNLIVSVSINGQEVGTVATREILELPISADSEIEFKYSVLKLTSNVAVFVPSGKTTKIQLSWDRMRGRLIARVIDSITQ